ncbi:MAG: ribosomal protein S18-alanine N-acetyltransferase [Bdellovibrionales bacterium]|nr:ribosomal protein S18-alanine N-acetyltransferase [Bdellovibrionales bacterium]
MNITGKLARLNPGHKDFAEILELDRQDFPRPWSTQDWKELNWDHHLLFAWLIENRPVGFALFSLVAGDDTAHLLKICIMPEQRGQGSAQALWNNCQQNLKSSGAGKVFLEVEVDNLPAVSFYKKLGFETLRLIKGYYSDGTDAMTMQITI